MRDPSGLGRTPWKLFPKHIQAQVPTQWLPFLRAGCVDGSEEEPK